MSNNVMLFFSALMAHWLFTFGGVALVGFGLYEKYRHKETHKRVYWVVAIGLLVVAAFQAWQDEHNNTQTVIGEKQQLAIDKGVMQGKLDEKDREIDYLKSHQTIAFNPTIKMPEQRPSALFRLSSFATSYYQDNDINKRVLFVEGKPIGFNYFYTNAGNAASTDTKAFGRAYIVSGISLEIEKQIGGAFRQASAAIFKRVAGSVIQPNGKPDDLWFTVESEKPLDSAEIEKIAQGKDYVYLLHVVSYKDPTGAHTIHYCSYIQSFNPIVYHSCAEQAMGG